MLTSLESRLRLLIAGQEYRALKETLDTLSHSRFRMAGQIIGQQIAPQLRKDAFWDLFRVLTSWQPKAFLVTMAKSAATGIAEGRLSVDDEGFGQECERLRENDKDRYKMVMTLLPVLTAPEDIRRLLVGLGYTEMHTWIALLLADLRLPTAYLLLQALHYVENDRTMLLRVAVRLKTQGDWLSFNMASLMRTMFGLEELGGTYSLQLDAYQLSGIEQSYEVFCKVLSMR